MAEIQDGRIQVAGIVIKFKKVDMKIGFLKKMVKIQDARIRNGYHHY